MRSVVPVPQRTRAAIFATLGDEPRLGLLAKLAEGEA
jgi:hypothetical protein